MAFSDGLSKFNNTEFLPEGWFWLLSSGAVKKGQASSCNFRGKDFVVYRGEDEKVRVMDAYCPHMGAHLGDGKVQGNSIRCLFHDWKFSGDGECEEIPTQACGRGIPRIRTYKTSERYGLIWIWTGLSDAKETVPEVPELEGQEISFKLGNRFVKNCHPNVVMINAIDQNHFNTVHNLFVDLDMQPKAKSPYAIRFQNATRVPKTNVLTRLIARFYKEALTYEMTYWYGHTGCVTLGPDFLHFYILFALRPSADGKTEGQTILVTKKRAGVGGWLLNRVLLFLTQIVGNYFAKGDTIIFSKIKFDIRSPVSADRAIVEFIKHYEQQSESKSFSNNAIRDQRRANLQSSERNTEVSPAL